MQKIPFSEALSHVRMVPPSFTVRRVNLIDAVGHVLAEPIYAGYNVPPAPVSAMDGFAVSAKETETASETHPLTLTQFDRVNTGEVVRPQFDAVIMVEDTEFTGEHPSEITIRSPIKAGRNVRLTAEDIRKGGLVLPAGAKLRSFDIGAVAGYGITEVAIRSVSVGVIPTGTELIEPGIEPKPGEVVESNTVMTEAYLREFGVDVIRYPPAADDPKTIRAALEKAVSENDLVLLSAGSSMGSHDYTSSVIEDMGRIIFRDRYCIHTGKHRFATPYAGLRWLLVKLTHEKQIVGFSRPAAFEVKHHPHLSVCVNLGAVGGELASGLELGDVHYALRRIQHHIRVLRLRISEAIHRTIMRRHYLGLDVISVKISAIVICLGDILRMRGIMGIDA